MSIDIGKQQNDYLPILKNIQGKTECGQERKS